MKNPWTMKNPWMSLWLSGANTMMNAARGQAGAQAKRQQAMLMAQSSKQITDYWASLLSPTLPSKSRTGR